MASGDPLLLGLLYTPGEGERITRIAEVARAAGLTVVGVVQHDARRSERRGCDMTLVDLSSGRSLPLSEERGGGAAGCRMDHAALEEAAGLVLAALEATPPADLVVLSKFGKREVEGRGFRQVIERASVRGVPVLVGVSIDNLTAFRAFGGGLEEMLEGDAEARALVSRIAVTKAAAGGGAAVGPVRAGANS